MKEVLESLIRLQELEFVRTEQGLLQDEAGVAAVEGTINELIEGLPKQVARLYQGLRRNPVVVVAERQGSCSACRMKLPTSQIALIRAADSIQRCQSCGRILYHMDDFPAAVGAAGPVSPGKPGLLAFTSAALVLPQLETEDRDEALGRMIDTLVEQGVPLDRDHCLERAIRRESEASTLLGKGLAFPHVRGVEATGLRFVFATRREGIRFGAAEDQRAQILSLAVIPTAANTLYLRLLSELIESLQQEKARARLIAADTPAALWKGLVAALGSDEGPPTEVDSDDDLDDEI